MILCKNFGNILYSQPYVKRFNIIKKTERRVYTNKPLLRIYFNINSNKRHYFNLPNIRLNLNKELKSIEKPVFVDHSNRKKALIAIVGRPNVGKSTLFNRLLKKSRSLISKVAGTTRDRRYGIFDAHDYQALLVDTGGLLGDEGELTENINEQGIMAIDEADIILFLTSLVDGLHPQDKLLARLLRNANKPVIVCVNKCDIEKLNTPEAVKTFERLGFGQPIPISASHGRGMDELADSISHHIENLGFEKYTEDVESNENKDDKRDIRIAIVGVPNVGKSSLLNQIIGSQRAVVSDIPGTTTDPVDSHIVWKEKYPITLVDTAGIRKKKSQEGDVERLSSLWSLKVIENSHLVILVIDASKGPQLQDIKLSGYIIENYKSCIIVINKWDLAKEITSKEKYEEYIRNYLKFWDYIPIIFTSAKQGLNVDIILDYAVRIMEERDAKISTNKLFNLIKESLIAHPPPSKGKKKLKIRFMTQANMYGSPTFVFFVNYPELAEGPFSRFLENTIRSYHPFTGTPIRILIRKSETNTKKKSK